MSNILDRRELLRGAAITATAASYSRILGANDKMSLGLIGAGERGQHDMSQFQLHKDVGRIASHVVGVMKQANGCGKVGRITTEGET